jgi:hypothetical protein
VVFRDHAAESRECIEMIQIYIQSIKEGMVMLIIINLSLANHLIK